MGPVTKWLHHNNAADTKRINFRYKMDPCQLSQLLYVLSQPHAKAHLFVVVLDCDCLPCAHSIATQGLHFESLSLLHRVIHWSKVHIRCDHRLILESFCETAKYRQIQTWKCANYLQWCPQTRNALHSAICDDIGLRDAQCVQMRTLAWAMLQPADLLQVVSTAYILSRILWNKHFNPRLTKRRERR